MSGESLLQERQNSVCQKNEQLNSLFFTSEEDFIAEYEQDYKDTPRAKEYTFFILDKLKKSIVKDDIDLLKSQYDQLEFVSNSDSSTVGFLNDSESPVRWTTLIIEACKYNRQEILEYLLRAPGNSSIQWSGVQDSTAQLERTDEETHNAFYYAVRSSNTHLLKTLIDQWPHQYWTSNPDKLDEVLAKAYSELKLKNVLISKQMEVFVQQKLIDLRFFSDEPAHVANPIDDERNIKERIELVLENIRLLIKDFSNSDVNERFLHILRFIGHNAHVLKGQLRLTCDRLWTELPWGEIVFCIVCFVSSHVKRQEINLLFNVTLSKSKILEYLKHFENKLETAKAINRPKYAPTEHARLKREKVVEDIINSCTGFKELYCDHEVLMDYYSLDKISCYLNLIIMADPEEREGRLLMTRGLQIIGEHVKNSLDSPKISSIVSELLLESLQKNTIKIMKDLRNEFSHSESLLKRLEIEDKEDCSIFTGIQNDAKKIDYLVADILYRQKIKTLRRLLEKITEIGSVNEAKKFAKLFKNVDFNYSIGIDSRMTHQEELESLVKEFGKIITDKSEYEEEQFKEIDSLISSIDSQPDQLKTKYCLMFASTKSMCRALDGDKLDLETVKTRAERFLELTTPTMKITDIEQIIHLAFRILDSARLKLKEEDYYTINKLIFQMAYLANYNIEDVKWTGKLKQKLKTSGISATRQISQSVNEEAWNRMLELKLLKLQDILDINDSNDPTCKKMHFCKTDKIQSIIGILVLDVLLILKEHKHCLEDNKFFVDDNVPLLTGKSLRDYLTHDGAFLDMSPYDPAIAIVLNARKLTTLNIAANKKLGKPVRECPAILKTKFGQELQIICNQEKLFTALSKEEASDVTESIENGADINGRSTDLRTALHFASVGPNIGILEFVLKNNIDPKAKDLLGQTALHIAAERGQHDKVKRLLEHGGCVSDVDNHGKTPLHLAARNGHKNTVETLLNHKACVFTQDYSGATPLYYAVRYGHLNIIEILMEKDVTFDINQTIKGFTLLYIAAESGNLSMVNFLLEKQASVEVSNDNNGGIPLCIAAEKGHLEIVKTILRQRSPVNHSFLDGFTSIHCAALNGYEEVVDTLLDYNADPDLPDQKGFTPLYYAALNGHKAVLEKLLDKNANPNVALPKGITPLHAAARRGHADVVRLLSTNNPSINDEDINQRTALHFAATKGHKDTMRILIENGASVNAKDINDFRPLHVLVEFGHSFAIPFLSKKKAEMNATSKRGITPLYMAAFAGFKESVSALIEQKAEVNCQNLPSTPLHAAARRGHIEIVELLLHKNAAFNVQDTNCDTPLHAAAEGGDGSIVQLLIRYGVDVKKENKQGCTPLILAIKNKNKQVVEILLNSGATIDEKTFIHCPLSTAIIAGDKEIVDMLLKSKTKDEKQRIRKIVNEQFSNSITISYIRAMKSRLCKGNSLTPLHLATLRGNMEVVKSLMTKGVNVDVEVDGKLTSLHCASAEGLADVVEILIENNADVLMVSEEGTPLYLAVEFGHDTIVEILLNHPQVQVDSEIKDGLSALHFAVIWSHLRVVKAIVSKGCRLDIENSLGCKPIHIAATNGSTAIVECFLDMGLNINIDDKCNKTPLHFAAQEGHLETVNFLIARSADINRKDTNGASPLHLAALSGHKDVVESLLRNGAFLNDLCSGRTPREMSVNTGVVHLLESTELLFKAVMCGSSAEVKNAIEKGAVIDAKNIESKAPLHYAAWSDSIEIVNLLLDKGANPSIVGTKGFTPLHYASKASRLENVIALLSHGATYNGMSDTRKTPLHLSKDNADIRELLTVVDKSFDGVKKKSLSVTRELHQINDEAKVKAILCVRDENGHTLIEVAILSNFPEVKKLKWLKQETTQEEYDNVLSNALRGGVFGEEALNILTEARKKRQDVLGKDNPGTLDIQHDIAKVLYEQGKYQESFEIIRSIDEKRVQVFGMDHEDSLKTQGFIALVRFRLEKWEHAFFALKKIYQKQKLLPNNEDTFDTLFYLAQVMEKLGDLEDALDVNGTVLNAWEETFERSDPKIISLKKNRASILLALGEHENAKKMYQDVHQTEESVSGLKGTVPLNTSVEIMCRQRNYTHALNKYNEMLGLQIVLIEAGVSAGDTQITRYKIATVKLMQGKYRDAKADYEEILKSLKTPDVRDDLIALGLSEKIRLSEFMCHEKSSAVLEYVDLEYLQKLNFL